MSTIVSTVPAEKSATQDTTRVNHLLHDLQRLNPEAGARIEPDQRDPQSTSHMIRITGTGLDLMPLMDLRKYELVVDYFRATRSGANAVIVLVCKPVDRELLRAVSYLTPDDILSPDGSGGQAADDEAFGTLARQMAHAGTDLNATPTFPGS